MLVDTLLNIMKKFRATGNLKNLYKKWIRQSFFCSDVAHSDGKDLAKITISDKILKERAYKLAKCKI